MIGAEPSAIVEEYKGRSGEIKFMQILFAGQTLKLNEGDVLVLGYLRSCLRETIVGGSVKIGEEQSEITDGNRKTEDVDCDGGSMIGPISSRKEVAAAVFRKGNFQKSLPKPDWTLFGVSPIFKTTQHASSIKIERLDKQEKTIEITSEGLFVDMAKEGVSLVPSALYRIAIDDHKFHLKISPLAKVEVPILSRIVVFDVVSKN